MLRRRHVLTLYRLMCLWCWEVFLPAEGENFYFIQIGQGGRIYIQMSELDEDGEKDYFIYEPNMDERPHALAYLMGERDDFDD